MDNQTAQDSGDSSCDWSRNFLYFNLIVSCITAPSSFFGNTLIIVSLWKYPQNFRGSLYMFTGNLAAADILLAVGIVLHVFDAVIDGDLTRSMYWCVAFKGTIGTAVVAAGLTFMFMAKDRLFAVFRPVHHRVYTMERRRFTIIICIFWVIAICLGMLPLSLTVEFSQRNATCVFGTIAPKWYTIVTAAAFTWMIVFTHVTTAILLIRLRGRHKKIQSTQTRTSAKTQLMTRIYLLFGLCWLPYIVLSYLIIAYPEEIKYVCIREYALTGGLINSGLNWIIYGLANHKFRTSFKKLLCWRCFPEVTGRKETMSSTNYHNRTLKRNSNSSGTDVSTLYSDGTNSRNANA